MQEENENINPLQPDLAQIIRQNINHQREMQNKLTLFKESIFKISLDKDLEYLFQVPKTNTIPLTQRDSNKNMLQATQEIKEVCEWLEDSQEFSGLAYVPFQSMPRLLQILHQKVEGVAIVLTDYPTFWMNKMQELSKSSKMHWGILTSNQQPQQKVKVLQLYQLKKLKLLFTTPNLFKYEEYHQFECDVLIVGDMHLYHSHSSLIDKVIEKTNPNRVLALHHTLINEHYASIIQKTRMVVINKSKATNYNFIVLKTLQEQKFKSMFSYLSKGDYKRILIVVNGRQEATVLNRKLQLQSKITLNLFDYLGSSEMSNFTVQDKISNSKQESQQQLILSLIKKINNSAIVISKNTDFLRFCNFDIAIYSSFTDVVKFVQSCFTTKEKLLLFAENDYYNCRNNITSQYVTLQNLKKIVINIIDKPIKREEKSKKRFYSDCNEENIFNCYSTVKQHTEQEQEKVIRINSFCKKNQISSKLFNKVIDSLQNSGIIGVNYQTIFQIEINQQSLAIMKRQLPMIEEVRRKVNLLNESTNLQKTIRSILDQLKKENIKYKITQEAIQIKILKDCEDVDWNVLQKAVNQAVTAQTIKIDHSFDIFKECVYSSIELTRRQKTLKKKEIMLDFFKKDRKPTTSLVQSYHQSNLLISQIQEWIRNKQEMILTDHELVLLLQGVQRSKLTQFKEDPLFGRYKHLKYEQLIQTIQRMYSLKKVKLDS